MLHAAFSWPRGEEQQPLTISHLKRERHGLIAFFIPPAKAGVASPAYPCAVMSMLSYTIAACSSEDEQHPARELQSFHSHSRGWQSAHFCDFPQEVVLRFEGCVTIQQVQLLSHQFKIASRVELFVGKLPKGASCPPTGVPGISFSRLGHFSLDVNARSRYQARELKTVYVPQSSEGHYLRLLLHKCHVNESLWVCCLNFKISVGFYKQFYEKF